MNEILMVKLGEIVLKGLNRRKFETALFRNIRHRLSPLGKFEYSYAQSTLVITPQGEEESAAGIGFGTVERAIDRADDALSRIFGIASITRAVICEKEFSACLSAIEENFSARLSAARTFKVEAKRSDKHFPMKSPEICREAGGFILDNHPNLTVDVRSPDITVNIEIRDRYAAIHTGSRRGAGGLPVSCSGRVALLLSGGIDSPVAGYMLSKRGAAITAVHFESFPYTSVQAKQKVVDLATLIARYCGDIRLFVVSFTEIQEQMRGTVPDDLFTIIMRRFMMRITERIARENEAGALVTGESLGQVASQTLAGLAATDNAVSMPVFRPLIGMDKNEIIEVARKIGTFDKSTEPYEDCCVIFSPKHPDTKPKMPEVLEAEAKLSVEALIDAAYATAEVITVKA